MQQISLKEGMSHIFLLGGYALHTAQSILEATSDEDYTKALNKDVRVTSAWHMMIFIVQCCISLLEPHWLKLF